MTLPKAARISVGAAAVALLAIAIAFLPMNRWTAGLIEWVHQTGALGIIIYSLVYVLATLLLLPGSLLTVGAGFLYGPLGGTALVSPVSVVAAVLAFLLGRYVARNWAARGIAMNPKFAAVDAAVAQSGLKIVILLRLSPILPFNFLNYALGLTSVRLPDYVLGSFIGMLPGTFLYVYLGSLVTSASELAGGKHPQAGSWGQVLYWGGFAATILATVVITKLSRRALQGALEEKRDRALPLSEVRT